MGHVSERGRIAQNPYSDDREIDDNDSDSSFGQRAASAMQDEKCTWSLQRAQPNLIFVDKQDDLQVRKVKSNKLLITNEEKI